MDVEIGSSVDVEELRAELAMEPTLTPADVKRFLTELTAVFAAGKTFRQVPLPTGPGRRARRAAWRAAERRASAPVRLRHERRRVPPDLQVPWWEKASRWRLLAWLWREVHAARTHTLEDVVLRRMAARELPGHEPEVLPDDVEETLAAVERIIADDDPRLTQLVTRQLAVLAVRDELRRRDRAGDRT